MAASLESPSPAFGSRSGLRVLRLAFDVSPARKESGAVGVSVLGSGGCRVGSIPSAGAKVKKKATTDSTVVDLYGSKQLNVLLT